jgi:hypothetical protein
MEFVTVLFPESRGVNVDQAPQGLTGEVIRVQAGIHRFDLGTPRNYTPPLQRLPVSGTTLSTPLEIVFTALALGVPAGGVPLAPPPAAPRPAARSRSAKTVAKRRRKPGAKKKAPSTKKKAKARVRRKAPKASASARGRKRTKR